MGLSKRCNQVHKVMSVFVTDFLISCPGKCQRETKIVFKSVISHDLSTKTWQSDISVAGLGFYKVGLQAEHWNKVIVGVFYFQYTVNSGFYDMSSASKIMSAYQRFVVCR